MIDEPGTPDEPDLTQVDHEQPEPPSTGNETVDGVLESLDGLADAPVSEHVAVFEGAHEQLRSALDGPRDA